MVCATDKVTRAAHVTTHPKSTIIFFKKSLLQFKVSIQGVARAALSFLEPLIEFAPEEF
jgi:hypothetical protein